MKYQNTFYLFVCMFFVSGCDVETGSGPEQQISKSVPADLPPVEVREGDGLPQKLPEDLVWETNDHDPTFASPEAKRGGTFRSWMLAFPLTLRTVGPDSNGRFAGFLRYNRMGLVTYHPESRRPIPALATHWAFGADGRSIYYRLNPNARWSDGVPVTADDYIFSIQFMRSKEIVAPWYNNYFTERIRDVKRYDDHTIGIQGATPKPIEEMHYEYGIGPQPRHFHVLDQNWVEEYNWKWEPNTGPYQISEVRKGKYIELRRKDDWWANDLKYFKHRFNPDKVRVRVIRDMNIAWQHFIKGELDTFGIVLPHFWHEKATGEPFDNGYIAKYWFYNELPVPSAGMFLNTADPILSDSRVRFGLAHAMNFDRVIETVLRGDYSRLQTFQFGFGAYDNRNIQAREYNLDMANEYLDAAGYATRGPDGIREYHPPPGDDGESHRLSLRVTYGSPHHTERLVILREEARKAGVELELSLLDSSGSFKQMQEKKHQIAWMTWGSQGLSPRYWEHFHSVNANKTQTNNITNFADPVMDELIMTYRASTNLAERVSLAHRLEQTVHDAGVVIPTFQVPYTRESAWRWMKLPPWLGLRTSGALFNSQALSAGLFSSGGLFWIDTEEKKRILEAKDNDQKFEPVEIIITDYKADNLRIDTVGGQGE